MGSATGRNGIYQRWQDYIRDGHGNDTGLIAIVKQHGLEYVQTHFRYTLLEHYDFTVPKDVVLARESYWKESGGSARKVAHFGSWPSMER